MESSRRSWISLKKPSLLSIFLFNFSRVEFKCLRANEKVKLQNDIAGAVEKLKKI